MRSTRTPRRTRPLALVLLVRYALVLLALACGGPDRANRDGPAAVAVSWVSAWIRRDVVAMCRINDIQARRGSDDGDCQDRMRSVTGTSDTPWTYGRPGVLDVREVTDGVAVWVSTPDTARPGRGFDWVLLLVRGGDGHWLVDDYQRVSVPLATDPIEYLYGGQR